MSVATASCLMSAALAIAGACSEVRWQGPAPAPLGPPHLPDERVGGEVLEVVPTITLDGVTFEVTAEVIQDAPDAPPVRLRATATVALEETAGAPTMTPTLSIVRSTVTPEPLTAALGLAPGTRTLLGRARWPLEVIGWLGSPPRLRDHLATAPTTAGCTLTHPAESAIVVSATQRGDTHVVTFQSAEGVASSGEHRGEIRGHLALDAAGRPTAGQVRLRRWTRFDAAGCRLAQTVSVTLAVAR